MPAPVVFSDSSPSSYTGAYRNVGCYSIDYEAPCPCGWPATFTARSSYGFQLLSIDVDCEGCNAGPSDYRTVA